MKNTDIGIMAFTDYQKIEKNSDKNIYVFNCGYFITHKKTTFLREHNPGAYLLIYLHKGTMQVLIDNKYTSVEAGSVLIFHPYQIRNIIYDKNNENERYFIYFQGPDVQRFLEQLSLWDKTVYKTGDLPQIINLFKAVIDDFKQHDFAHDINRLIQLLSILQMVHSAVYPPKTANSIPNEISYVMELMKTNLKTNYDVKFYAEQCYTSVPTFIRRFNQYVGVSPMKYLRDLKIEVAKAFLVNTNLSVTNISLNLGMDNPLYFSSFFKKNTGLSPSDYRKQNAPKFISTDDI